MGESSPRAGGILEGEQRGDQSPGDHTDTNVTSLCPLAGREECGADRVGGEDVPWSQGLGEESTLVKGVSASLGRLGFRESK